MAKKWEYEDFCGSLRVVDGTGDVVAELVNPNDEESAMLMAAAPELLDALKAAQKKGSRWHPADPVVQKINAAIAKATGEHQ